MNNGLIKVFLKRHKANLEHLRNKIHLPKWPKLIIYLTVVTAPWISGYVYDLFIKPEFMAKVEDKHLKIRTEIADKHNELIIKKAAIQKAFAEFFSLLNKLIASNEETYRFCMNKNQLSDNEYQTGINATNQARNQAFNVFIDQGLEMERKGYITSAELKQIQSLLTKWNDALYYADKLVCNMQLKNQDMLKEIRGQVKFIINNAEASALKKLQDKNQ